MNHWLHPDAEKELGDAAEYYLHEANLQIAEAFLAEYERVRDLVIENRNRAQAHANGLRFCPLILGRARRWSWVSGGTAVA